MAWTNKEAATLRKLYPTAPREIIEAALPRHPWSAIGPYAHKLGLRRRPAAPPHPHPIMRALRRRRIELGIKITELAVDLRMDRGTLMDYETHTYPSMRRLFEWASLLGFDLILTARREATPSTSTDGRNQDSGT